MFTKNYLFLQVIHKKLNMLLRLILIFALLLIFYFTYEAFKVVKRKTDRKKTDLKLLKPRRTGVLKEYDLHGKDKDILQKIVNQFEQLKPKMLQADNDEALIYIDYGTVKTEGLVNTPYEKMPIRIILKKRHKALHVQIDEDYKAQMLVKSGQKFFRQKYEKTFNHYLHIIEDTLHK